MTGTIAPMGIIQTLRLINEFPKRDIKRCPAIKLAVSRTQRVIGRIILLVNSIITINIIKGFGVPWGTKWAKTWLVFFVHPNSIKEVHKINEIGRVTVRWEVREKTWGYSATKFIKIIAVNVSKIMASLPFSFLLSVKDTSFFLKWIRLSLLYLWMGI